MVQRGGGVWLEGSWWIGTTTLWDGAVQVDEVDRDDAVHPPVWIGVQVAPGRRGPAVVGRRPRAGGGADAAPASAQGPRRGEGLGGGEEELEAGGSEVGWRR